MNELNISSYIQILQSGLMTNDKQESAGVFLLSAINDQDYVGEHGYRTDNLSSKKISRLVSRLDPVPDALKQASVIQCVIDDVIQYFQDKVTKDLNPHLKDDVIDKLVKLINADTTIPDSKKTSLIALKTEGDEARFLAEVFLYALNKPNKRAVNKSTKTTSENIVEYEDAPLLAEANYECPLCHKKLIETIKGQPIKNYCITRIFPDGIGKETAAEFNATFEAPSRLDAPENLIALDKECSAHYLLCPSVEEYKKLREVKEILSRNYVAKAAINTIQLEEDIRTVLDALSRISSDSDLIQLNYEALRIDEKILPENYILKIETQMQVITYYRYIEKVFSESEVNFDIIATEVKLSSQKLENTGMTQAEVVAELSEWIRQKSGLGPEGQLACNIVVSFFIQNCEVFYK